MSDITDFTFGRGYLINYYTLLRVDPLAPDDKVAVVAKKAMRRFHSDNVNPRAEELHQLAEDRFVLLAEARDVLCDHRAEYDALLASWDGPISTNGMPTTSIGGKRGRPVLVEYSDSEIEAALARVIPLVELYTGHDPAGFAYLKKKMKKARAKGTPKPGLLRSWMNALEIRTRYLAVLEARYREILGLDAQTGRNIPGDVLAAARQEIEAGRTALREQAEHLTAIGGVKVKAITGPGGEPTDTPDSGVLELWVADRVASYDSLAERLVEVAADRAKLIAARLELVQPEYRHEQPYLPRLALCYGDRLWYLFVMDTTISPPTAEELDIDTGWLAELDDAGIRQLIEDGISVAYIAALDGLPIEELVAAVAGWHFAQVLRASKS